MAGREVREYTNLTDPKDKKWGKGKDKIDDEEITFQRMVAKLLTAMTSFISRSKWKQRKMQNVFYVALRRGHLLHLRYPDALLSSVFFSNFLTQSSKCSRYLTCTTTVATSQQDLLKNIVEIRPKRHRVSSPSDTVPGSHPIARSENAAPKDTKLEQKNPGRVLTWESNGEAKLEKPKNEAGGLLGLAYESSDED
ncbi:hypothetical protein Taro_010674 [Colocasia esculenta]|uniref:Uncharacterized protein n=1 Tax=Colocasia esculenta TaxID=4460 RepID=A0A843U8C1_COLES|nr:hypothetical protein [Colocasia esculenta]